MAIVPITSDNLEKFKLQTNPKRTLVSSSNGLTGSIPVFGRVSPREKDAFPPADFTSQFDSATIEQSRLDAKKKYEKDALVGLTGSDIHGSLETYLDAVNKAPQSLVKSKRVEIVRFEPSHKFTKDSMRKNVVKNVLFPRYRTQYKSCDWSYPNYHTLNFFTGSTVSGKSCLIYPNSKDNMQTDVADDFPYSPGNTFTFEFWINPRYTTELPTDGPGGSINDHHYHAGTLMHLSSSYCISLVTGSTVDVNGYPDSFRVMFQLGHAAQIKPSNIGLYNADGASSSTNPRHGATLKTNQQFFDTRNSVTARPAVTFDLTGNHSHGTIALSKDQGLKRNHWHHVAIRGGKGINGNIGSFYIDGVQAGDFPVCASGYGGDLMPLQMSVDDGDPDALIVGNYLETMYTAAETPAPRTQLLAQFFNVNAAYREGLVSFYAGVFDEAMELSGEASHRDMYSRSEVERLPLSGEPRPKPTFDFSNPLNAEVHELRIWKEYRSVNNIVTGSQRSLTELSGSLIFYVPPWFTKETRIRDVLQTPFQSIRSKTDDPFNVALSFGVGGRELNLPNFTRELVQGVSPRHYHLVARENPGQTEFMSANELMYDAEYTNIFGEAIGFRNGEDRGFASIRKGNLTVLPNDNGLFSPRWDLLGKKNTHLGTFGITPASASISYTGQPADNDRITLTSAAGSSRTFVFKDSGTNGSKDTQGTVTVKKGDTGSTPEDTTYSNFTAAIKQEFGSHLYVSASLENDNITIIQKRNGSAGNTRIVTAFPGRKDALGNPSPQAGLTNAFVTSFGGGTDDPVTSGTPTDKFVDDFGAQNLGIISLEKMVSTASIPEGLVDIVSEFRGLPGVGAAAAQAEITWSENVVIQDGNIITLTAHNDKTARYKFLNSTKQSFQTNGSLDADGTVIVDARVVDSDDTGETPNINDVWRRFVEAVNATLGGSINASIPVPLGGADYDTFEPTVTSVTLTQAIKGEKGNTAIKLEGKWDAKITIPSNFTGGRDNPDVSILNSLEGASPEDPGIAATGLLTILNRTRDPSSNEVIFFDASNLFYGNRIKPGTFSVKDSAITGSGGRVSICLRDNEEGGLYRDDCLTKVATWNEIGTIIYEEGISVVKTPNIPFFGKDQFEVTMQGEHNVHVLEINVPAPKGKINSSSNPTYRDLIPSDYASETADKFVYITTINLHDENFNIIGRANLAQPVVKRDSDGYMFRLKMDY